MADAEPPLEVHVAFAPGDPDEQETRIDSGPRSQDESTSLRHRKRPRERPTSSDWVMVICIALTYTVKKIVYFGILANLVVYCTNVLEYTSADAAIFALVFVGANYFLCLFGGWLSDAVLGHYNAIYLGLLVQLAGNVNNYNCLSKLFKY